MRILERIPNRPYVTSIGFFLTAATWGTLAVAAGFYASLELIAPDLFQRYAVLTFGRLRPVHVSGVAYGFVFSLLLGGAAYVTPRLCKVEGLWSERLGVIGVIVWNLVFVGGAVTLPFGYTQGREWAELIWPIDVLVAIAVVIYMINVYMTIFRRKEPLLYVSLWYFAGGIAWTLSVYFLGNVMWDPRHGSLTGIIDSVWLWFYGHNVVGLILTPMAVGLIYWVLPRAVDRPVWNHTMSLMGFWLLLVIYTHTGTHHLLQAPVPRWLKVISIVDSIALVIPVLTVLLNVWLPMRGRWGMLHDQPGAKFVFAGSIWYAIVCFQGPMQSLPSVQLLTHFTQWVIAHAHIAILGFAGFVGIGSCYTILPLACGKPLYSRRLADVHYWVMLAGLTIMFFALTIGGLVQGNSWLNREAFYRVVPQLHMYLITRSITGIAIFFGVVMMAYNIIMTLRQGVSETATATDPRARAGLEPVGV